MKKRVYGWKPELPDIRDIPHVSLAKPRQLPDVFRLEGFPPCWDQGSLGSCVGHGVAAAVWWERHKLSSNPTIPSRLMIYYGARSIEHTIKQDSGAAIRDGVKAAHKLGVCRETVWPYIESKFARKPTAKALVEASQHRVPAIFEGFPVIVGFSAYDNFESDETAKTGLVSMPNGKLIGGHCVLVVGWDDAYQQFICRNSWGTEWGQQGYFRIPYDYLADRDLADDFWTLQP
jgi:C1A family cysteine protease